MKKTVSAALLSLILATTIPAYSAQEHHPADPNAPAASTAPATTDKADAGKMEMKMKNMQEMKEKMMAAKTPEEMKHLMHQHMEEMKGEMKMMQEMGGKDMGKMSPEKKMAMMEKKMGMMMEMMNNMMAQQEMMMKK